MYFNNVSKQYGTYTWLHFSPEIWDCWLRNYWKKSQLSTPTILHLMSLCHLTGCILLGVKPVSFTQWEHIDKREQQIGSNNEKPREKIVDTETLLNLAHEID